MVSHTGVAQVKLQHPETVVVMVVAIGGGHVVHVGEIEHDVHVGWLGQVGKLVVVVVVVVVVLETGGAVQLQHPEVMFVKFIYVVPPPQIGLLEHVVQELIVVVVVVVSVITEPVYTVVISVLVTVNVFCAGHVSDFECGELDDGVHGGRVGVYHRADVVSLAPRVTGDVAPVVQPFLPPPSSPRSRFLASATKQPNNVTKSKNFIFRSAALA
jgi:hypothetical protein